VIEAILVWLVLFKISNIQQRRRWADAADGEVIPIASSFLEKKIVQEIGAFKFYQSLSLS